MKKIIFALSLLLLCSCSYLDVVPEGKATEEDIWKTEEQAENYRYYMQTYMPNLIGYDWSPDQFARRRLHHRSARHDLLFFEQEPALRRGERQPDLFRPLGPELHQRRHELRHLPRHTLLFLPAGQHLQSSRSLAGKRRPLRGRGVVPRGILPPVPARILRTDRTGQEVHPHRRARIGDPHSADSLRRVREVHRRVLRPGRRLLPDVVGESELGLPTKMAALSYKARLLLYAASPLVNGQSRLHRVQQPRRHAPDEHDLRSGKVETGAGRGSGGDRPRRRDQSRHEKTEIRPLHLGRFEPARRRTRPQELPRHLRRRALERSRIHPGQRRAERHSGFAALRRTAFDQGQHVERLENDSRADDGGRRDVLHQERAAARRRPADQGRGPVQRRPGRQHRPPAPQPRTPLLRLDRFRPRHVRDRRQNPHAPAPAAANCTARRSRRPTNTRAARVTSARNGFTNQAPTTSRRTPTTTANTPIPTCGFRNCSTTTPKRTSNTTGR